MFKKKYFAIILIIFAAIVLRAVLLFVIPLIFNITAKVEVYDDPAQYESYLAYKGSGDSQWRKWGMDESIWPAKLTETMNVVDYKMVYYNPWDAQYLGYLVVDYLPEEYDEEVKRLIAYPSTEYIGYYGVVEETTCELLAINADPYQGFVYALAGGENRIILRRKQIYVYNMVYI